MPVEGLQCSGLSACCIVTDKKTAEYIIPLIEPGVCLTAQHAFVKMCSCLSVCLMDFSYWRQLLHASIFKLCYCAQERALVNFACTYFLFSVNILLILFLEATISPQQLLLCV